MEKKKYAQNQKSMKENKEKVLEEIGKIWSGFTDEEGTVQTDVLGSYLGTPQAPLEEPTQDADDL